MKSPLPFAPGLLVLLVALDLTGLGLLLYGVLMQPPLALALMALGAFLMAGAALGIVLLVRRKATPPVR